MQVRPGSHVAEPGRFRRYTVKRLEKRTAMAQQSWPEFWGDLGMRFLVAGAAVVVVLVIIWALGLFVH